jgi:hypothetical protein
MAQSQRARLARLERRVSLYLAQSARATSLDAPKLTEDGEDDDPDTFQFAIPHAINLAYIIKFGTPRIREPLADAWQRTGYDGPGDPFESVGADGVSGHLLATVFSRTGACLKAELNAIFESAPAWLIWFTKGDLTAEVLGLKLPPDMFSLVQYARTDRARFPALPREAFAYQPRRPDTPPETTAEAWYLRKAGLIGAPMSRREEKRAQMMDSAPSPAAPPLKWPDSLDWHY